MDKWSDLLREWGPLATMGVLLALGGASIPLANLIRSWRSKNGNGKRSVPEPIVERRVEMPEVMRRLDTLERNQTALQAAFLDHDRRNADGRRALHEKIEAARKDLHEELSDGLLEVRTVCNSILSKMGGV